MDIQTVIAMLARRGLMAAAASLITWGWLQPTMSDSFVQIGLGIASGAASLLLSWWNEKGHALIAAELIKLKAQKAPTTAAAVQRAMDANKP
jgi:hypothetical protein